MWECGLRHVERAVDVDVHHVVEVSRRQVVGEDVLVDTGVVDDVRDAVERLDGPVDESPRVVRVAHVRTDDHCLLSPLADLVGDRLGRGLAGVVVHRDVVPVAGEAVGDCAADTS